MKAIESRLAKLEQQQPSEPFVIVGGDEAECKSKLRDMENELHGRVPLFVITGVTRRVSGAGGLNSG
jgi:hypothetical protein